MELWEIMVKFLAKKKKGGGGVSVHIKYHLYKNHIEKRLEGNMAAMVSLGQ